MSNIYLALNPRQKDFESILLQHAMSGKDGWVFVHLHPRLAKLLDRFEEAGHGQVTLDLRDGLPENVNIAKNYDL